MNEKFRVSKLFKLLTEVWFYSWLFLIIRICFLGTDGLSLGMLLTSLFPVTYIGYWFVSAYVAMYILMPILNRLIISSTKKQLFGIICILVAVFSLLNSVLPLSQVMGVQRFGQSLPFFCVLYIIGSFFQLHVDKGVGRSAAKKCLWSSIFIVNFSWVVAVIVAKLFGCDLTTPRIQGLVKWYFSYDSLPVLFASIAIFHLCRKVTISNIVYIRVIKTLTPLIFGVYLIHCNQHVIQYVWMGFDKDSIPEMLLPIAIIVYALIVFALCITIDYIRSFIFFVIYKSEWYKAKMDDWDCLVYAIYNKLYSHIFNSGK